MILYSLNTPQTRLATGKDPNHGQVFVQSLSKPTKDSPLLCQSPIPNIGPLDRKESRKAVIQSAEIVFCHVRLFALCKYPLNLCILSYGILGLQAQSAKRQLAMVMELNKCCTLLKPVGVKQPRGKSSLASGKLWVVRQSCGLVHMWSRRQRTEMSGWTCTYSTEERAKNTIADECKTIWDCRI